MMRCNSYLKILVDYHYCTIIGDGIKKCATIQGASHGLRMHYEGVVISESLDSLPPSFLHTIGAITKVHPQIGPTQ